MQHLLGDCPFSRLVWHAILSWCRLPTSIPSSDVPFLDWWAVSFLLTPAAMRKGFTFIVSLTAW